MGKYKSEEATKNNYNYIREYKKNNYKYIRILLKPEEKEKIQIFLKNNNITLKNYIFQKIDEDTKKDAKK